jgi:deoxyribose-phosphate aldolase
VELNRYIDHTLLAPGAMDVAFESHLEEAVNYNFYSVCVAPYIALSAVRALAPYPETKVCTVVGFPHGNIPLTLKLHEAAYFVQGGIHELDWVLHYGEALNEAWSRVALEMGQMARLCRDAGVVSKCIVESAYFPGVNARARLFQIAQETGVDFLKTSTGFGSEGANLEHVRFWKTLQREEGRPYVKAAGGIKTLQQAEAFLEAGARRLGTSASVGIMLEYEQRKIR